MKKLLILLLLLLLLSTYSCGVRKSKDTIKESSMVITEKVILPSFSEKIEELKVVNDLIVNVSKELKWNDGDVVFKAEIKNNILGLKMIQADTISIERKVSHIAKEKSEEIIVKTTYPRSYWWLLGFAIISVLAIINRITGFFSPF